MNATKTKNTRAVLLAATLVLGTMAFFGPTAVAHTCFGDPGDGCGDCSGSDNDVHVRRDSAPDSCVSCDICGEGEKETLWDQLQRFLGGVF